MKGVEATANVAITAVILLTLFGTYVYMANRAVQSNIELNTESLEILKLKSTFEQFNRSLGMTWLISTVQTVFATTDESMGCGFDNTIIEKSYWYKGRDDRARDFWMDNFTTFRQTDEKYNSFGANPQICWPRDSQIIDYMTRKMDDDGYRGIEKSITVGGVDIEIGEPAFDISMNDTNVLSAFAQTIKATFGNGVIDTRTENKAEINSMLKRMAQSGRTVVEGLMFLGDAFYVPANVNQGFFFQPITSAAPTPSADFYKDFIRSTIISLIGVSSSPEINRNVIFEETSLTAGDAFFISHNPTHLIFNYKARVRYSEKVTGATPPLSLQWPTDSRRITSCFGFREDPIDDFGRAHNAIDIGVTNPNIAEPNFISSIADGTVDSVNTLCTSASEEDCGGGYGNFVLIKHNDFYSFYAHLGLVDVTAGEAVAAGQVIGVMGSTGRSTNTHLHLEIRQDGTTATKRDPCNYIDCSQSTQMQCAPLAIVDTMPAYYYHDLSTNTFEKRPITMEIKVEDHLPALDCGQWVDPVNPRAFLFNYQGTGDVTCCGGHIFSCNADIDGLPQEQLLTTGDFIDETKTIFPQRGCAGVLQGQTLTCGANGFS